MPTSGWKTYTHVEDIPISQYGRNTYPPQARRHIPTSGWKTHIHTGDIRKPHSERSGWLKSPPTTRSGSEQDVSGHFSGRSSEVKEPKRGFQNGKMNIFRLAGDMTHLASVLVLLLKIHTIKSCAGVSLKTQELYAMVFAARRHKIVRRSYDKDQDTFRHLFLILPCLLLALFINEKFTFKEVMWTFSIYLEAVAILPQLVLLQRTRNIDNLTGQYVLLLG
nr:ER lumen protein-retaining receptor [Ipomoea batatas]GMD60635.1 ER lumen protein-retaining receptor [Ipomoea batatas]GMD66167.1 ER lumen protein-retaining receptor [Ipomoea batatas]GMD68395.1 ER lumen protein-retaining receptor [Ipomoea batatas]